MKITNANLQASLSKMMAQGSPLSAIIQEQKPKKATKRKPKQPKQSKQSKPVIIKQDWRDVEYDHIRENFTFVFNNQPYEATRRHKTVTLLDLATYQSSITHTLWVDEQLQSLHHYLQVNWEQLSIHDTEDASDTTFLVDELFHISYK